MRHSDPLETALITIAVLEKELAEARKAIGEGNRRRQQIQSQGSRHASRGWGVKPSDCKSIADVCSLQVSHEIAGRWSLLIQHDGAAIFTEQRIGKPPAKSIEIPRREFQKLLAWYEAEQP